MRKFPLNFQKTLGSDLFCDCSESQSLTIASLLYIKKADKKSDIAKPSFYLENFSPDRDTGWEELIRMLCYKNMCAWAPSPIFDGKGLLIHAPLMHDGCFCLPAAWITHRWLHTKVDGTCCETGPGAFEIVYRVCDEIKNATVWTNGLRYAECALLLVLYRTPPGLTV